MRRILDSCNVLVITAALFLLTTGISEAGRLELPSEEFPWIRVETPNFTIYSNTDLKLARNAAASLEQLWMVLARDLEGVPASSPVPTSVYVFDIFSDVYPAYGPLSKKGKPERSGGFFFGRGTANYMAIVERDYRYPNRVDLYHDFVHSVLRTFEPELPVWMEEGLAEYYSIFHIEDGRARVGYRINGHIARVRNQKLMPLEELLAVGPCSSLIDEDDRSGIFYAQSWLLTHFLVTEHPNGRSQMGTYAAMVREGVDRPIAVDRAFGMSIDELERQLKKYVRTRSFHYTVFPLSSKITTDMTTSEMPRVEVLTRLGDLLRDGRRDRDRFAAEHYREALALDPGNGPAQAGLGLLEDSAIAVETTR